MNIDILSRLSGDKVTLQTLKEAGLIRKNSKLVKLLGKGDVSKPLQVEVNFVSATAQKKIQAAGGTVA